MEKIELDAAVKALESAFAPNQCTVRELNYGNSIVLEVTDKTGHLLLEEEHMASDICNPDSDTGFPAIVETARTRLEERGCELAPKKTYL